MDKLEQMDELIAEIQKDEELQKELVAILQFENPKAVAEADEWLADNGYGFTLRELCEHLEGGVPLSENQLDSMAGGNSSTEFYEQLNNIANKYFQPDPRNWTNFSRKSGKYCVEHKI